MNIFTQCLRQTLAVAVMAGCAFGAQAKIEQVRFAVDPTYPPFESKTPQGKLVGFDIDLGNALCTQMQAKCVWVESQFDGMIPALKARKFDAILSDMGITEERLIQDLSSVDLLVIDEIGMQSESRYEKVIINQIVDRRSSSKRPTGMLSNLDHAGMNALLGERVMDRMRLGNSLWVRFDWESYRSRVRGDEY